MGDNVEPINHRAEWIKSETESAPLLGTGASVPEAGRTWCFRDFVLLALREQSYSHSGSICAGKPKQTPIAL